MGFLKNQIGQLCLVVALLALIVSTLMLALRVDQLSTEIEGLRHRILSPSGKVERLDLGEYAEAQRVFKQPSPMASDEEQPLPPPPKPPEETPVQLLNVTREPFKLLFNAYSGEGQNFQINLGDRSFIVANVGDEIGDRFGYTGYKITKFEKKSTTVTDPTLGGAREVDVSELTVQHEGEDSITLIRARVLHQPELLALVRCGPKGPTLKVGRGQRFVCDGKNYRIVEITSSGALINDETTGKKRNVERLAGAP